MPHVCPRGAPGLVMGQCIVEIDRIVTREVQYQLEVNLCNFGRVWPMWAGRPRVGMHIQYQSEVNLKGNLGWAWPIWAERPWIDLIVIREVQYQLKVNRCRNEEVIPMWVGRLRVFNGAMHIENDRIVIREFQYQFEVNRCRNEEIIVKGNFGWVWSMWAGRPRVGNGAMHKVHFDPGFQGSSVGGDSGQDGQTDGQRR
ncbi:hypothetical protein DPMN_101647 [Dreissena polymorpha]|uniref:Uncharacterized protein n=1 Tax=Dreissena polymorpha TaxID=45954 RepID=A0A9D4LLJ2_DREPO|nr:hypothetical protein DPMN_101647 [Dreissena polymorpha]